MQNMENIRDNLPMSMTMAAFTGVSWYIGIEVNFALFMLFRRRRGLYFWSCALVSWGVVLQPLFIILADFGVWKDLLGSITMIHLTWVIMVVPQSWVLFSRLHLIVRNQKLLRYIRPVLMFNTIAFSVPTIVVGILAQATNVNSTLADKNIILDRTQMTIYFVQETALGLLYISETRKYVRMNSIFKKPPPPISSPSSNPPSQAASAESAKHRVLWDLIFANILIIVLDVALLGIQFAGEDLFYLQGSFKPCVYGVKLKIEFLVLNRLISSLRPKEKPGTYTGAGSSNHQTSKSRKRSADAITSSEAVGGIRNPDGLELEPIELPTLPESSRRKYPRGYSVLESPDIAADSERRLVGTPTEPWDGTQPTT